MDSNLLGGLLTMEFGMILLALFIMLIVLAVNVVLLIMVYKMAVNRHREGVLWLLLGVLTSPLIAMIILLVVGDDDNRRLR